MKNIKIKHYIYTRSWAFANRKKDEEEKEIEEEEKEEERPNDTKKNKKQREQMPVYEWPLGDKITVLKEVPFLRVFGRPQKYRMDEIIVLKRRKNSVSETL